MTLKDFARKEARIAKEQGIGTALYSGICEAAMKNLSPYAKIKERPIWDSGFDVCLVLDSCRYDLWEEVVGADNSLVRSMGEIGDTFPLATNTEYIWSVGSASPHWISKTFNDDYRESWESAGYVTANPFSGKQGDEMDYLDASVVPLNDTLPYVDDVWQDSWPMTDELPTVSPKTLTDRALWAYSNREQLGIDRLVVHYMQPHIPFRSQKEWCAGWDLYGFGTGGGKGKNDWHKVRDGEIERDLFWKAYADNLEWVLAEVKRWYELTSADILVTSDHGNGMGEFGQWGHPPGSANPAIRKVPFCEIAGVGSDCVGDVSVKPPDLDRQNTDVEQQLQALGYKT